MFDNNTLQDLTTYGFVLSKSAPGQINNYENNFFILKNDSSLLRSLKTALIDRSVATFGGNFSNARFKTRDELVFNFFETWISVFYSLIGKIDIINSKNDVKVNYNLQEECQTETILNKMIDNIRLWFQWDSGYGLSSDYRFNLKADDKFVKTTLVLDSFKISTIFIPVKDVKAPKSNFAK